MVSQAGDEEAQLRRLCPSLLGPAAPCGAGIAPLSQPHCWLVALNSLPKRGRVVTLGPQALFHPLLPSLQAPKGILC